MGDDDEVMSRRRLLGLAAPGALGAAGLTGRGGGGLPARSFRWQAIPTYSLLAPSPERAGYVRRAVRAYERATGWHVLPEVSSEDIRASMAELLLQASQGRAPEFGQVDSYVFPRFARYARNLDGVLDRVGLRPFEIRTLRLTRGEEDVLG